jgi:hypothetical protein
MHDGVELSAYNYKERDYYTLRKERVHPEGNRP